MNVNKQILLASVCIAAAGWVSMFGIAFHADNQIAMWRETATEMFMRACSEEQNRWYGGPVNTENRTVTLDCYDRGSKGALFSLPPQPVGGRP